MPTDRPDFQSSVLSSEPVPLEGQVPWYFSDAALVANNDTEDLINYVVPDGYDLNVCSGAVSCDFSGIQRYDLRTTPAGTWVSPTSHSDPDSKWENEEDAYDNNVSTYSGVIIAATGWSSYLILLINEQNIDKVKFYAWYNALYITKVDIDVYYDGDWHDVYEGVFADREWVEKDIPAGVSLVSKARIRYYNTYGGEVSAPFYEFMFNTSGITPQEGTWFNTHAIIPYLPQAPYVVPAGATFAVRVYNEDAAAHNMSVALSGFLNKVV